MICPTARHSKPRPHVRWMKKGQSQPLPELFGPAQCFEFRLPESGSELLPQNSRHRQESVAGSLPPQPLLSLGSWQPAPNLKIRRAAGPHFWGRQHPGPSRWFALCRARQFQRPRLHCGPRSKAGLTPVELAHLVPPRSVSKVETIREETALPSTRANRPRQSRQPPPPRSPDRRSTRQMPGSMKQVVPAIWIESSLSPASALEPAAGLDLHVLKPEFRFLRQPSCLDSCRCGANRRSGRLEHCHKREPALRIRTKMRLQ